MASGAIMSRLRITAHDCIFLRALSRALDCSSPPSSLLPFGLFNTVRAICSVAISLKRSRCSLSL